MRVVVVARDRCIGCGNCVTTCESEAISLRKKEKEHIPFKTMEALYVSMLDRRKILKQK